MNSINNITKNEWKELSDRITPGAFLNNIPDNVIQIKNRIDNPFLLQNYSWGTQSTGWLHAWEIAPSPYVVAARKTQDIVEAVNFAREHNLKLVVKGTGHDYIGRSNAPNSLLVWTHHMRQISMKDDFIPLGAPQHISGTPAVTIEAGARWGEVYQEVTTKNKRYVQGGGCTTVGAVGGFLQGGGFGSFSKKYGLAASNLIEAEVVLASGQTLIVNEYQNQDLFWALKGGGGGTFGIISKATLQTHQLPSFFGALQGKIVARSDEAFKELLKYFINFYRENLNNEHWGEQIRIKPDNSMEISLAFQGLTNEEVEKIWDPFKNWVHANKIGLMDSNVLSCPSDKYWDYDYYSENYPNLIHPASPNTTNKLFYWNGNQNEVQAYWYTYRSRWLPVALFDKNNSSELAEVLFKASRYWEYSLHFNKGLSGASNEIMACSKKTSINPVVYDSAALLICGNLQSGFGDQKNDPNKEISIKKINKLTKIIAQATPHSGSYSNETDYFQEKWREDFWGNHYPKLLEIKKKYDPQGFFKCHHSVGSELS